MKGLGCWQEEMQPQPPMIHRLHLLHLLHLIDLLHQLGICVVAVSI
jgi:hypothetical protein